MWKLLRRTPSENSPTFADNKRRATCNIAFPGKDAMHSGSGVGANGSPLIHATDARSTIAPNLVSLPENISAGVTLRMVMTVYLFIISISRWTSPPLARRLGSSKPTTWIWGPSPVLCGIGWATRLQKLATGSDFHGIVRRPCCRGNNSFRAVIAILFRPFEFIFVTSP